MIQFIISLLVSAAVLYISTFNSVLKTAVILASFIAAVCSNISMRPDPSGCEVDPDDYTCIKSFPLCPVAQHNGKLYYEYGTFDENKEMLVHFKCKLNSEQEKEITHPRSYVRLIYDANPCLKIYRARKKFSPNYLFSIFPSFGVNIVYELHTPDEEYRNSTDKRVGRA